MDTLVTYTLDGTTASIAMDDGKVNALSPRMLAEIGAAFDRARDDGAGVILTGRKGTFSAGFDLRVLRAGGVEAVDMIIGGFRLAEKILSFPMPVVIAITGHAVAMGAFLLLSGDHLIGGTGDYRILANEVAIGLTMPHAAVEICRQRLTPAAFNRAVILAESFTPDEALAAGFLDQLVPSDEIDETARSVASRFAQLNAAAHTASKLRARAHALEAIAAGIDADEKGLRSLLG
ncbi:MAG: crotonase/enoyl-CoA hydratase family protein [Actinomycetota bacterium]